MRRTDRGVSVLEMFFGHCVGEIKLVFHKHKVCVERNIYCTNFVYMSCILNGAPLYDRGPGPCTGKGAGLCMVVWYRGRGQAVYGAQLYVDPPWTDTYENITCHILRNDIVSYDDRKTCSRLKEGKCNISQEVQCGLGVSNPKK